LSFEINIFGKILNYHDFLGNNKLSNIVIDANNYSDSEKLKKLIT